MSAEHVRIENPIRLVRELKGAPISIVLALSMVGQRVTQESMVGQRVTQEWLERSTGYTDKPVSQALKYLREIGLVDQTSSGWMLTGEARQLPLMSDQDMNHEDTKGTKGSLRNEERQIIGEEDGVGEAAGNIAVVGKTTDAEEMETEESPERLEECYESRKYSDSLLLNTNSINRSIDSVVIVSNKGDPGRKNSDSEGDADQTCGEAVDKVCPDVLEALEGAGVIGQKRRDLAGLAWVDAGYVLALEKKLRKEKGHKYRPGLLIWAIEQRMPAPEAASGDEEGRRRYEDWEK